MRFLALLAEFALLACLVAACGPPRREEPFTQLRLTAEQAEGRRLFQEYCGQCHPGGSGGLGPAINNKPLPSWLIRLQVRRGFGAMPAFSKEKLGDAELERITAYLKTLRDS